ncbi:MAG: hypothetical protein QM817_30350 [Archangium sp.]
MNAIPDWKLERYRLKELPESDARLVSAALENDPELRARLAALEADDAATLAAHAPARVAARIELTARDSVAPKQSPLRWLVPVMAVAAALVLAFVLPRNTVDDDIIFKGDVALKLFRLDEGSEVPVRLVDGAHVKSHDLVQVAFDLQGAQYAVVVSVDGSGGATLHWPTSIASDTKVPAAFKALPQSFELDDAPAFERFFLVVSNEPLNAATVLDDAKRAGRNGTLIIPPRAAQRSLLLDKVNP